VNVSRVRAIWNLNPITTSKWGLIHSAWVRRAVRQHDWACVWKWIKSMALTDRRALLDHRSDLRHFALGHSSCGRYNLATPAIHVFGLGPRCATFAEVDIGVDFKHDRTSRAIMCWQAIRKRQTGCSIRSTPERCTFAKV